MTKLFPRLLAACVLAAFGVCSNASAAPEKNHPKAEAVLKAQARQKAKQKKTAKAEEAAAGERPAYDAAEEADADITDTIVTEYSCELNNKLTIYTNEKDASHIALRWKKRVHRLNRVGTTTGALRFENPYWGLIWIGIPSKGILLDSRLNRQLANECKNATQSAAETSAAPGKTNG